MKPIKILVVEDELVVALHICDQLQQMEYDVLPSVTNYDSAIESLNQNQPDIAILDIKLTGQKSGIDLARYINQNNKIPFVFLTSLNDSRTFDLAKELHPSAYLVKPFKREDVYRSIELALQKYYNSLQTEGDTMDVDLYCKNAFIIKGSNHFAKIHFDDIVFAKSEHVYMLLHTVVGGDHLIRSNMSGMLEQLPENFIQVHRSFIINANFIQSLNSKFVTVGGTNIPVGRSYLGQLQQILS